MPSKPKTKPATKILCLRLGNNEETRVEVPADSKVTFGPAIPGPLRRGDYSSLAEYAIRVYNGATEKAGLLAVFTNVREFREESIKISKLIHRESGKSIWKSDEAGLEVHHSVKRTRALLPEDEL